MYKLNLVAPEKDIYVVKIKGDSNDGDYITEEAHYTKEEFERCIPELKLLLSEYAGSHELQNFAADWLNIPGTDYGFCHTLYSVEMQCITSEGLTYDIELDEED